MPDGVDVAWLAAELEIRNLIARVAQLADGGELDDYLACYTDDAVWEMPANPKIGLPASTREGAAAIREGVVERRRAKVQGPGTHTLHVVTTTSVAANGDGASAHSYWLFYADTGGAMQLQTMGQYHDTFRPVAGRWKLARRRIMMG